jgi:hypothetical protein
MAKTMDRAFWAALLHARNSDAIAASSFIGTSCSIFRCDSAQRSVRQRLGPIVRMDI